MDNDSRLLTKIATLYYNNGLTQAQIAQRLGLSRQTIGRRLEAACAQGIVEIHIRSPLLYVTELENQIEQTFNLAEVIVISPAADTEEALKEALGQACAEFLRRRVGPDQVIAVSWSSTVLECAERLQPTEPRRVTVVQMNGSMDRTTYSTRAEYIIDRIARAFGGRGVPLVAPMMVDRAEIKESLLGDSRIAAALDLASRANIALIGVGDVSEQSSLYKAGYLDDAMLRQLQALGAAGDICGRFFDGNGQLCAPELDGRTLAIDLDTLRTRELAIAIAGGLHKVPAILGALRGGYANVLITDEQVARALLTSPKAI
ncbi:MAG: sugar-binding transcriptional regulator [Chloroflexota bacterium]|nr:sugar-binding transcriptional regulator [Chloroflexota bacterium]